jgi:hypothetical protein
VQRRPSRSSPAYLNGFDDVLVPARALRGGTTACEQEKTLLGGTFFKTET